LSVVGPTGCGKSTLLNVAAGLLAPSTGSVQVFGQPLQGINPRAGYMFQAESLMPWRTALGNVMAGLEFRGVPDAQARAPKSGCAAWAWAALATVIRTSFPAACASAPAWPRRWRWTPTSS
jgi:ABC-type nitrate/sulfonate/bicarbonate transport system ATPase subunit